MRSTLFVTLRSAIGLCAITALTVGCASTSGPVSAGSEDIAAGTRAIVGTSLVGVKGATPADQEGIDDTAAGLCGASVWTKAECQRHGGESQ